MLVRYKKKPWFYTKSHVHIYLNLQLLYQVTGQGGPPLTIRIVLTLKCQNDRLRMYKKNILHAWIWHSTYVSLTRTIQTDDSLSYVNNTINRIGSWAEPGYRQG